MRTLLLLLLAGPSVAFVNGRWFTGYGFTAPATRYSVNGMLQEQRPMLAMRVKQGCLVQ